MQSDSRKARALSRRIAVSISAWSPRSSPSDRSTIAAPRAKAAKRGTDEEGEQRRADARAAVPVVDQLGGARKRRVAVADSQRARDAGEPRAEREDLGAVGRLHDRMGELADSRSVCSFIEPEMSIRSSSLR